LDRLTQNPDQTWTWKRANDDSRWTFSSTGLLISSTNRTGWTTTYTYSTNGLLTGVTNPFGRQVTLGYNPQNHLTSVQTPDGRVFSYGYDSSRRLTSVTYPDTKQRQFVYEHSLFPNALTGIVDENNKRWGTFVYDAQGRAISSELAGGVSRYEVGYPAARQSTIKDPLGVTRSYIYSTVGGASQVASSSAASGPNTSVIANRTINAQGLVTASTDFKGNKSTTSWDLARFLQTDVTEGFGTAQQRSTSYTWHSNLRLPVGISRTGRTTTFTYDTQGRPLSRTIVDTTVTPNTSRTSSWTYNSQGLVATATAANGSGTQYTYDGLGNVATMTNALGHVTTYSWDSANRLSSVTFPNGRVVSYSWDSRDRLLTLSSSGSTRTMTYLPSGQVNTVTDSAGYAVTFQYDDAHRMTGWSDNRGHSGTYTLDAMGNRTQEDVRNAQGQTAWRLARTINSVNRAASVTVGGQTTTYGYDANGDSVSVTNGQGQSETQNLDALRRVAAITNAENATASLTYNALDSITQAKDFNGVATTYTRDALGNATTETSPDSGTETAQYDALGLPKTVTDALGQATTIERDLLGRPTLITYADGRTTTLRYDLTPASKGYLGEIVDASGTTTYERDQLGRITTKTQRLINGDTRSVSYSYNAQGLLASTTYPGGQALQYVYDTTGQLTGLTWAGQSLVSGITWNPLGQPTGWSWNLPGASTAIPASRSYNTAGQLTATEFSSYQYDAAGRIHGITQNLWQPASTNPQDATITEAPASWTVQYSPTGRITGFTRTTAANTPADTATFQYDANGNRKASTRSVAGTTTSRTYSGEASHNRLLGFSQTTSQGSNNASTSVSYQYNSAGDLLSDGLTSYHYDSEGRLDSATTGQGPDAPTTKYAHNALGQRVFKTEPLFSSAATPGTGKNLNNLLADDGEEGEQEPPGLIQQILNFWSKLWSPSTSDAEKLGWSYVYAEDGSLLGEYGSGGSASSGTSQYLYLPTASGPMPIAAIIKGQTYAIHSDHLNTPRKLTQADGQAAWQWAYSAFGEEQPTTGAKRFTSETTTPTTGSTSIPEVTFNLRYPGQYFDSETKLHYNHFRTYDSRTGRYTQADPIGLDGGWNRFSYVEGNPLGYTDPQGLNPLAGAWAGAGAGSAFGPVGTVVGGLIGAGTGAWIGWNIVGPMLIKPPDNAYDPNGPKAPGKPGEADGFKDPKGGDNWVPNPNPGKGGAGYGWQDANGDVWCPTGQGGTAHGGPHWDVQTPGGGYRNVRPQKK
jgi:RHS repeat-associated protein